MTIKDLTIDNLIRFLNRSFKAIEETKDLPKDTCFKILGIDIVNDNDSIITRYRCCDINLNDFLIDAYETVGLIGTSLKEIYDD